MENLENHMVVSGGANGPDWEYNEDRDDPRVTDLERAIGDFLRAVDRGDFGDSLRVGAPEDRAESAYVTALRKTVR